MVSKEIDEQFKLLCIDIAAREMIEVTGKIDVEILYKNASLIYHGAGNRNFFGIKSPVMQVSEEPTVGVSVEKDDVIIMSEGVKKCPKCGDTVPERWDKHLVRSNGEKCGHVFKT